MPIRNVERSPMGSSKCFFYRHLFLGALVLPLFFTASCVTSQKEMASLRNQMTTLNNRLEKLEASVSKRITVADLETKLSPIRQRQADTGTEVNKIKRGLGRAFGIVTENRRLIKRRVQKDRSRIATMSTRLSELEGKTNYLQHYLGLEPKRLTREKAIIRQPIFTARGISE